MSKSEDSVLSECGEYYFLDNGYMQVRLYANGVGWYKYMLFFGISRM